MSSFRNFSRNDVQCAILKGFPIHKSKKQNDHIIVNLKFFIVAFPVDSKNTGTTSSTPSSPLWWCQIYRSWTVFATLSSFGWWLERCPLAKKIHMCYVFNWILWGDLCYSENVNPKNEPCPVLNPLQLASMCFQADLPAVVNYLLRNKKLNPPGDWVSWYGENSWGKLFRR